MGIFGGSDRELKDLIEAKTDQKRSVEHQHRESREQLRKVQQTLNVQSAPKWEYVIKDDITEDELDRYGIRGWELVNVASFTTGFGLGGNEKMTVHMRYVFKRPQSSATTEELLALQSEVSDLEAQWAAIDQEISELRA